jgi:ribosome-associated toxin RatA of RatAB toxin-antitoxin module
MLKNTDSDVKTYRFLIWSMKCHIFSQHLPRSAEIAIGSNLVRTKCETHVIIHIQHRVIYMKTRKN